MDLFFLLPWVVDLPAVSPTEIPGLPALGGPNWNTIILSFTMMITALTPILLALINRKQGLALKNSEIARNAVVDAARKVETVRTDLATKTDSLSNDVRSIHKAVNSERTAMLEKLEMMHREIQTLSADKASLIQAADDNRDQKANVALPFAPPSRAEIGVAPAPAPAPAHPTGEAGDFARAKLVDALKILRSA